MFEKHNLEDNPEEEALRKPKYLRDAIVDLRKEDVRRVEAAVSVAAELVRQAPDVEMQGPELAAVLLHLNNVYNVSGFETHQVSPHRFPKFTRFLHFAPSVFSWRP